MSKKQLVYADKAGNKLIKRFIKSRDISQYAAYNREGKLVDKEGVNRLMTAAGVKAKRKYV